MTPPTSSHYDSASWPIGFRGIGGHLIRPRPGAAPPAPQPPPPTPSPDLMSHGSHLLASILLNTDGESVSPCPVCMNDAVVPSAEGWHGVRCRWCGTEYIATDGTPPPAVVPPVAEPAGPACPVCGTRPPTGGWKTPHCTACGIAFETAPASVPPPVARAGGPDETPTAVIYGTGVNARATCPRCRVPAVVPRGAKGWVWFTCASCGTRFKADSEAASLSPLVTLPLPEPDDADGRLWDSCPKCEFVGAMVTDYIDGVLVQTCTACGKRVTVGRVPTSPPSPPPRFPVPAAPPPRRRADAGPDGTPTTAIYTSGGKAVAPCPKCRLPAEVPRAARGWVWFSCKGCRKLFKADSGTGPLPGWAMPAPEPPPSFWKRVRNWFGWS